MFLLQQNPKADFLRVTPKPHHSVKACELKLSLESSYVFLKIPLFRVMHNNSGHSQFTLVAFGVVQQVT